MFTEDARRSDGWTRSLNVEWHDCAWSPVIQLRPRGGVCIRIQTKPLLPRPLLAHPARRNDSFKLMKKLPTTARRFRAGFTLVELLTVIAIIGILAAMLMPVLAAAKKKAQKMQAQTEIQSIVTAIEAYDQAYGRFPVSHAAQDQAALNAKNNLNPDFTYGANFSGPLAMGTPIGGILRSNSEVVAILMDFATYPNSTTPTINTNHQSNPKGSALLNAKLVSDTSSPGVGTDLVYRDPWGNPYLISMDLNYDEACNDALYSLNTVSQETGNTGYNGLNNPNGVANNFQFHGKIMVWSAGPDGKISTSDKANAGVNKDNILSWK